MKYIRIVLSISAAPVVAMMLAISPAAAEGSSVELGLLTCKTIPGSGINWLVHSSRDVDCVFEAANNKFVENYKGATGVGLGIDLSWQRQDTIIFSVIGAAADIRQGTYFLAGMYGGGKANVTLGVGVGAAALIGGGNGIALQPLALEGSTGLGVAAGAAYLTLEPGNNAAATPAPKSSERPKSPAVRKVPAS